jgi:hypothetical protein
MNPDEDDHSRQKIPDRKRPEKTKNGDQSLLSKARLLVLTLRLLSYSFSSSTLGVLFISAF